MTLKEFAGLFAIKMKEVVDAQEALLEFVSYISTQNIILGEHKFACVKTRERLLSRKYKAIRTELVFWEEEHMEDETFVISIDSTINNLRKPQIKYKNHRNILLREGTEEDVMYAYIVAEFEEKFPMYNHLLNMAFRARDENGNIIGESQELGEVVPLDEIQEMQIAL